MSCRSNVLWPLGRRGQGERAKRRARKTEEGGDAPAVLGHAPEEVGVLAPAEQLHKLLVVRDDDQLEVPLLASRGDNAAVLKSQHAPFPL